ncbi:MAG: hypothetical protein AAF907_04210, partial [Planctomycetota bacterium]
MTWPAPPSSACRHFRGRRRFPLLLSRRKRRQADEGGAGQVQHRRTHDRADARRGDRDHGAQC